MMTKKVKESYDVIVQYLIENSILEKSTYHLDSLNKRQKKWFKLSPQIYVIGPKEQMDFFIKEANFQDFLPMVNFLYPKMINELLISHEEDCKNIINWIIEEHGGRPFESQMYEFYVFGCHISHVIISIDIIKNNHHRAIVFENDAKFYDYVEDETLNKIIDLYEQDSDDEIGFLNLGFCYNTNHQKEFKILKGQTATTHTYIINQKTSKLLVNSTDTNNLVPKWKHDPTKEKEFSYRCGADGFFGGFVDNFFLNLPLTYQQFIGTNRKQSYL
jgi:GR25 family glycosyltransferase involved in LPS biosynthesis